MDRDLTKLGEAQKEAETELLAAARDLSRYEADRRLWLAWIKPARKRLVDARKALATADRAFYDASNAATEAYWAAQGGAQ